MLIEQTQREARVRFQHPIRVVTLEGQPRVIRTLTSNVSRDGLFVRMPEPLPPGMKVALSLEAGGRALALAQAEVRWNGPDANEITERFPGCGVRFTEFLHPRAEELVQYLVKNLDTGKPLALAPPEKRWAKYLPFAGGAALLACAAAAAVILWDPGEVTVEEPEETPSIQLQAQTPIILPLPSGEGRGEGKSTLAEVTPSAEPVAGAPSKHELVAAPPESATAAEATNVEAAKVEAAKVENAKLENAKLENAKLEAATVENAKLEAATVENAKLEAARLENVKAEGAKIENAKVDGSKIDGAKVDVAKVDVSKAEGSKVDGSKVDGSKVDGSKVDAAKGDAAKVEVAKLDVANVDAAKAAKLDAAKNDAAKNDAAKNDAAKLPAAKNDAAKFDAAKTKQSSADKKRKAERQGDVKLAAGASPQLHWEVTGTELRLVPQLPDGVQLSRAFVLSAPARAVFDLTGGAAARSVTVPAAPPYATGVRIGKQPAGTRIVVDLDTAPKNTKQLGDALVLAF